ncbi:hypothetical protein OIU84_008093 [Salix udensis]|uniref:Protein kinase domain-containing protein n=1 Tax=Salix udensis TaxID=889485 RepID=A0AAD6P085_9ROSI|nr:hypothetical protein OIU84_008093 [Salix udensis]
MVWNHSRSQSNEVVSLELSYVDLFGKLPSNFTSLSSLKKAYSSRTNLTGFNTRKKSHFRSSSARLRYLEVIRAGGNKNLEGSLPREIGKLQQFVDIRHGEKQASLGFLPPSLGLLKKLQTIAIYTALLSGPNPSRNLVIAPSSGTYTSMKTHSPGSIPKTFGQLRNLKNLLLGKTTSVGIIPPSSEAATGSNNNKVAGTIPPQIGNLKNLNFLDLGSNRITGNIPGRNLGLSNLTFFDLHSNAIYGNLPRVLTSLCLSALPNLVVLNVSHNNFSGHVSDMPFFSKLPLSVLTGNPALCFSDNQCDDDDKHVKGMTAARVAMVVLLCTACALLLAALYIILGSKKHCRGAHECDNDDDLEMSSPWEVTLYQKLDLSIADVARSLTAGNVIGQGRSGVVYKVAIPSGLMVAVKRGWCWIGGVGDEVQDRIRGGRGASLFAPCVPPILHRDVKSHNILLGDGYEAFLADFGLARVVEDGHGSLFANPQFAGSYGYIAPGVAPRQFFDYVRSHFGISDEGDLKQDLEMGSVAKSHQSAYLKILTVN